MRELGRALAGDRRRDRELAVVLVAGEVAALVRVRCAGLAAGGFGRCRRGCALAVVDFLGRAGRACLDVEAAGAGLAR